MGDVVGDDLGLLERNLELAAVTGMPQWLVVGNHDIDFDAKTNDDKTDSAPGQLFHGWAQTTGIGPIPFRHNVAGAASGAWYQGDFNVYGVPMTAKHGFLGTFMNAGQFQGQGERFLAIRLPKDNQYQYGWIRVFCSQHNDTLRIVDYAYNRNIDRPIKAGQTE